MSLDDIEALTPYADGVFLGYRTLSYNPEEIAITQEALETLPEFRQMNLIVRGERRKWFVRKGSDLGERIACTFSLPH